MHLMFRAIARSRVRAAVVVAYFKEPLVMAQSLSFRGRRAALLATASLAFVLSVVGVQALLAPDDNTSTAVPTAADPQRRREISPLETELVTVTPRGFEPGEIVRPQGRFILMVDNRSGLNIQLRREAGSSHRQLRLTLRELDWSEEVDLPPGDYVLTEDDRPGWSCRISITPR
jgi:hypothetical protein